MSKALTALFALFVLASATSALDDFRDRPDHRLALAISVAALLLVLIALGATRRPIPVERRRGEHLDGSSELVSWVLAIPFVAASALALLGSAVLALATAGDPMRSVRVRRIARHSWRTWVLVIVAGVVSGVVIEQLDGGTPVSFAFGCIALATTRLGTRWMDRSDAAAPATQPSVGGEEQDTGHQLPSPIQLG